MKVCARCGYYLNLINGQWVDEDDDDQCYDEDTNGHGEHIPVTVAAYLGSRP